jgi:hypothetical protein
MQVYEIRILRPDRSAAIVIEMLHFGAKKIAEMRLFEGWRDLECLYGVGPASPPSDQPIPHRRLATQPSVTVNAPWSVDREVLAAAH